MKPQSEKIIEGASEREILKGNFRNVYLVYNRKSTDEPNNQKNSIKYQKLENVRFALHEQLSIASLTVKGFCRDGIISEKHSGFKETNDITITRKGYAQYKINRPKFQRLVRYLSKGYFKGVVVLCYDRISRNKGDDTVVKKLIRKGVDIRFVDTVYDNNSSGELYMDIQGSFSAHYSRVTGERVKKMGDSLRAKGLWTHRAPIGYLNQGSMIKPLDPERAPIIKRIFELYATGKWSLSDLARWGNEQGLTMSPMRKRRTQEEILEDDDDEEPKSEATTRPITAKHIHSWFFNPFYLGKIILKDGTIVKSESHTALVSEDLVQKIHQVSQKRQTSIYYEKKLDLPYRGLVRCNHCLRVFTPYFQKDIEYLYARCSSICENTSNHIKAEIIEDAVGDVLSNLYLSTEELIRIDTCSKSGFSIYEERMQQKREENDRIKKRVREDLEYLHANKLPLLKAGVYTPEAYFEQEMKLNAELRNTEEKKSLSETEISEVIRNAIIVSELLKGLYIYYIKAKKFEKEKIIRSIFSELYYSQNSLKYQCKNGIEYLKSRLMAVCGDTTQLSELNSLRNDVNENIKVIKSIIRND